MTSLKRPSDSLDQGSNKKPKVHPFFTKSPSTFKWLPKIDNSCWTGVNSDFEYRTKVAIFDIDGTLLKSPAGGHPVAPHLWEWWNEAVPAKLKELYSLGFAIILVTNQGSTRHIKNLEEKLPKVASKIPDLPFLVYAAPNKDQFRKPRIGTFRALQAGCSGSGISIDISASFFVGDAAGRQRPQNSDHSDCDIKYAANIGIQFYTPEEYFLGLPKPTNIVLKGFHPLHTPIPVNPLFTPTSSPLIPSTTTQEIILFVGYPALGKTSFFNKYLAPSGYVHVNQDTLKTLAKCQKVCTTEIKAGKSVVIDNTNRDCATRAHYIAIAQAAEIPVRCFWFSGSLELARHNNLYRAFGQPLSSDAQRRALLPDVAFSGFTNSFEKPAMKEGFQEIKQIHWSFTGSEQESAAYNMWYMDK